MRPQQQNRRMRGRNGGGNNNNNNNRRGPNPLNRNYESNGPDVKIRGSAQQIAEKYAALARDAQSSGDRVMAENYLQHAEHYNRIIAAAQAQMPIQQNQQNRDDLDDEDDDREEFENGAAVGEVQAPAVNHGAGPQPVIEGTPAEVALNGGNGGRDNGNRDGGNRDGNRQNRDRRNGGHGQRNERNAARSEANGSDDTAEAESAPVPSADLGPAGLAAQVEQNENGAEAPAPRKTRRPRRSTRAGSEQTEAGAEQGSGEAAEAVAEG